MIRRILVALDADTDTPVATRYAAEIAERWDAAVSGVAVVDMGSIERGARGGGIGSMYLTERLEASLTAEARAVARDLLAEFRAAMATTSVKYEARVEEGVPVDRIVVDANYCDLLVIGQEPRFYYSHPTETTMALGEMIRWVAGPVLVVPAEYREITRVLVAFDGSQACVRSLRAYLYLRPFGRDVAMDIVNVHPKGRHDASQLALHQVQAFAKRHRCEATVHSLFGAHPNREIVSAVERLGTDLLVAGVQHVTPLSKLAFGSTTASLLADIAVPMWLES